MSHTNEGRAHEDFSDPTSPQLHTLHLDSNRKYICELTAWLCPVQGRRFDSLGELHLVLSAQIPAHVMSSMNTVAE